MDTWTDLITRFYRILFLRNLEDIENKKLFERAKGESMDLWKDPTIRWRNYSLHGMQKIKIYLKGQRGKAWIHKRIWLPGWRIFLSKGFSRKLKIIYKGKGGKHPFYDCVRRCLGTKKHTYMTCYQKCIGRDPIHGLDYQVRESYSLHGIL